jgi:hypothetical protein
MEVFAVQNHNVSATDGKTAWINRSREIAEWADANLVNRRDAWGGYYRDGQGRTRQTTHKAGDKGGRLGPLGMSRIRAHFAAAKTDAIIGLHSTFRDEAGECWSRWLAIDIDCHDDSGDPGANLRFALALFDLNSSSQQGKCLKRRPCISNGLRP